MSRVIKTFGHRSAWNDAPAGLPTVEVRGPHNSSSEKWALDMLHSSLALYWAKNPERARHELAQLRAALDFIESQVLPEAKS